MKSSTIRSTVRTVGRYVAVYVAWFAISAIGLLALVMWREALLSLYVAMDLGKWGFGAADKFSFLIFGIVWLVGVLYSENYFRVGADEGVLGKRIVRVVGIEAILLAIAFGVQLVAV